MVSGWTIGNSQRKQANPSATETPGPSTYQAQKVRNSLTPPQYSIPRSKRSSLNNSIAPGVGTYNIDPVNLQNSIQYSIAQRFQQTRGYQTPGPASYFPQQGKSSQNLNAPAFTLGSKNNGVDEFSRATTALPGPSDYQTDRKFSTDEFKQIKFSTSSRNIGSSDRRAITPGPGQYRDNFSVTRTSEPRHRFSGASRENPMLALQSAIPGPGKYNIQDEFVPRRTFSIGGQNKQIDNIESNKIPGPGAYNLEQSYQNTARSVTTVQIGTATRDMSEKKLSTLNTPGPGQYDISQYKRKNSCEARFGSTKRVISESDVGQSGGQGANVTPGPGTYNYQQLIGNGPKFTFRGSKSRLVSDYNQNSTPGPLDYNVDTSSIYRKTSAWVIGTSRDGGIQIRNPTPGPADYGNESMNKSGPKWGFSLAKRNLNQTNQTFIPGPGAYVIKPMFSDVPLYQQSHRISAPTSIHQTPAQSIMEL